MGGIIFKPPVELKRRTICRTDEAVVRRLRYYPKFAREEDGSLTEIISEFNCYDGMVERLQKFSASLDMRFDFRVNNNVNHAFSANQKMYHILKYMALSLAREAFPDNFLNATELRIFSKGDEDYAAMYSEFVPDRNGTRKRQAEARQLFYRAKNEKEKAEIRELYDKKEHELTPGLMPLIETVSEAGIIVPHPEANYHLTKKKIVFFEVSGINLEKALTEARRRFSDSRGSSMMEELARIHAAILRHRISVQYDRIMDEWDKNDHELCGESKFMLPIYNKYLRLPFSVLQNTILLEYLMENEDEISNGDIVTILCGGMRHISEFNETTIFDVQGQSLKD